MLVKITLVILSFCVIRSTIVSTLLPQTTVLDSWQVVEIGVVDMPVERLLFTRARVRIASPLYSRLWSSSNLDLIQATRLLNGRVLMLLTISWTGDLEVCLLLKPFGMSRKRR